jgi:hypothetical protein
VCCFIFHFIYSHSANKIKVYIKPADTELVQVMKTHINSYMHERVTINLIINKTLKLKQYDMVKYIYTYKITFTMPVHKDKLSAFS